MMRQFLKALCLLTTLLACSISATCYGQGDKPCLSYAYPKRESPGKDLRFDTAFDRVNVDGASFSCGPAIAASKARDALESFRYGVLYHDKARLNEVLQYPLTVGIYKTLDVEKPKIVIVHNAEEWLTLQKERMTKIQVDVIACSWLGNVTVTAGYSSPGFFIGGGLVWFQRIHGSAKVKVTSLNLMPLTHKMLVSSCTP
jgi:hypothetical protein